MKIYFFLTWSLSLKFADRIFVTIMKNLIWIVVDLYANCIQTKKNFILSAQCGWVQFSFCWLYRNTHTVPNQYNLQYTHVISSIHIDRMWVLFHFIVFIGSNTCTHKLSRPRRIQISALVHHFIWLSEFDDLKYVSHRHTHTEWWKRNDSLYHIAYKFMSSGVLLYNIYIVCFQIRKFSIVRNIWLLLLLMLMHTFVKIGKPWCWNIRIK